MQHHQPMETPIQILSEVDKDLNYTPRQLNAIKEMAFRFAEKVLMEVEGYSAKACTDFVNECAPGRDEKYDQDNNKTITEQ